MEYPLIIDGETEGKLTAREEGLYIAFSAHIKTRAELTRLWLHGAGSEAYLGIMSPAGEELCLERRISKRELGALWREAAYASNRSGEEKHGAAVEESGAGGPAPDEEGTGESGGEEKQGAEKPDKAAQARPEPEPADPQSSGDEEDGLIWYRTESGTLTAFDGKRRLTALPARLRHGNEGVALRTIEGREYIIFKL